MSVFHENMLIGASGQVAAGGISRSVRLNAPDSAHLSRTPASAGNRRTWTWAGWVKRSGLSSGSIQTLLRVNSPVETAIRFSGISGSSGTVADTISVYSFSGGSFAWGLVTSAVYRDTSAWYHIQIAVDTTQATASNRVKIYVNGLEVTALSTANYPTQNYDTAVNTTNAHGLGAAPNPAEYFSGLLADIYFIDGQALTPSSFTETDATTGQLVEKAYTGSYGSQGWHLELADNSSNTATTLGKDTSGNGNNWTPNNLSVTAGAGNDSLVDVPSSTGTDTGVGGEVRGNYCTWNPLDVKTTIALSNGNLDVIGSSDGRTRGTISMPTGKWYWEITATAVPGSDPNHVCIWANNVALSNDTYRVVYRSDGAYVVGGTLTTGWASWTTNDVIGVTFDADTRETKFYKNNSLQGTVTAPALPSGSAYTPAVILAGTDSSQTANFGQRPFAYTAPSGFKALNTANLPAPVVTKANTVFDTLLYTGNGSARSITGLGFNPDLVWIKERNAAADHALYDAVRGVEKRLESNTQDIEVTSDGGVTAFNSDGFSLGTLAQVNTNNDTYVAWAWDAGSSTVTNNSGSITGAQVRANATAGVSVVAVTKTGTGTVGHGLGVKPELIILKSRADVDAWYVHHSALAANQSLFLNTTGATATSNGYWNNTLPTSTVFSVGSAIPNSNLIAYCFAPVVGYSSFGSYTGNGSSTDGPFVYTGFRPRFILVKNTSVSGAWEIYDSARNTYNVMSLTLLPNTSDAEINAANGVRLDFTSNGFKWRDNGSSINGNGNTIIWAAFAEAPFNYARAR